MVDQVTTHLIGNVNNGGVVTYVGEVAYTVSVDITDSGKVIATFDLVPGVATPYTITNYNVTKIYTAKYTITPKDDNWKFTGASNLRGDTIDYSVVPIVKQTTGRQITDVNYTTLIVTAEKGSTPVVDNDPNKSYLLTSDEMAKFQEDLFAKAKSENTGTGSANINILDFVVGAKRFPFTIPDDYLVADIPVRVRDVDFDKSNRLTTAKIEIDLGSITVTAVNNSSLDFVGIDCKLTTPFDSSPIDLPDEIMGKTVSIKCIVDLINASGTVNIYDGDNLITSRDITIGNEYPIFGNYQVKDVGLTPLKSNNGIYTSFIRVRKPVLDGNMILSKKVGALNNITGYIEVENISLNIQALNEEKSELLNILKGGVYVK